MFDNGVELSFFNVQLLFHGGDLLLQDQIFESGLLLHFQNGLAELRLHLISLAWKVKAVAALLYHIVFPVKILQYSCNT
jgi:hypothetical protein